MANKRRFLDGKILKKSFSIIGLISGIISFAIAFVPWDKLNWTIKIVILSILIFVYLIIHIIVYLSSIKLKRIELNIENTHLKIFSDDIFKYGADYLKVIGFNEYFDTLVGEGIIDSHTLNGIFVASPYVNVTELNANIEKDSNLEKGKLNNKRLVGKKQRYKLGSVHKYNDFLLVALTKFDENNNARVTLSELTECFLKMWNEIDRLKGTQKIVLPLLASGQTTRIGTKGAQLNVTNQEILELIIGTLKISRIKIKKPADLTIVIPTEKMKEIDLFKVKEMY